MVKTYSLRAKSKTAARVLGVIFCRTKATAIFASILFLFGLGVLCPSRADMLPSWSDSPAKRAILGFVEKATDPTGPQFIPAGARVATFDNDGTLWSEQPLPFEFFFAIDQVKALAPQHPEWKTQQPFKAVLENDMKTLAASGKKGILQILMASHAGMTTEEFKKSVKEWIVTARHPRFNRPYTDLVFQPMLEVLAYFRVNGFKIYIVSGGGVEFMRAWTNRVYGIPPEQVVGSSIQTKFEIRDGKPVLIRLPKIDFLDDKAGKPVGINRFIGRRPVAAFGNSDGDLQMLQWTAASDGARLMGLIHHTDAEREWAYGRHSKIGGLNKALDEAQEKGWTVVDMKKDWKVVYPFQLK